MYFLKKSIIPLRCEVSIERIVYWQDEYKRYSESKDRKSIYSMKPPSRTVSKRATREPHSSDDDTAPEHKRSSSKVPSEKSSNYPKKIASNLPKPTDKANVPLKENVKVSNDVSNNGKKFKTPSTLRKPECADRQAPQTQRVVVNGSEYSVRSITRSIFKDNN